MNGFNLAVMHLIRGHEADPGVVMVLVVPLEERAAETSGILDAAEAFGEARLVFQRLEVALGERIVIRRVRTIMRAGDAKIRQQERGGFRFHRPAAIGVQRKLAGRHVVFLDRIVEQRPEQRRGFGVRDTPADHAAAVDIDDHVKVEVSPLEVVGVLRTVWRPS